MEQKCIFEDNIGVMVLKMFVSKKKQPTTVWNFSNQTTWERRYGAKTAFFMVT